MIDFKFMIGDRLTHQAMPDLLARANDEEATSPKWLSRQPRTACCLVVTSRLWEECPGGVQRKYVCRLCWADSTGNQGLGVVTQGQVFHEEELMLMPPVEKAAKA